MERGVFPAWQFYSNPAFQDTVSQQASVASHLVNGDWTYAGSQSYTRSSSPLIETGRQTPEQTYNTSLSAAFGGLQGLTLNLGANQDILLSTIVPNSYTWSTDDMVNWSIIPHLSAGVGMNAGYTLNDPGNNIFYTQPEVRASWQPTEKLSLNIQSGIDHQTVHATDSSETVQTFNVSLSYQPVTTTTATFSISRASLPAQTTNEITAPTTFGLNLGQRLLQHFYLSVIGSHETTTYTSTLVGLANVRDDTVNMFSASLSVTVLRRANISIQYEDSRDSSNLPGFSFSSRQIGFGVGYRY